MALVTVVDVAEAGVVSAIVVAVVEEEEHQEDAVPLVEGVVEQVHAAVRRYDVIYVASYQTFCRS